MEEAGDSSEYEVDGKEEKEEMVEVEEVTHQPSQVGRKDYVPY